MTRKTFYIVDGDGYIHRAFHALPPLTNGRGEPAGALFGFAKMLLKIIKERRPDGLAVCFDTPKPTFRHEKFKAYKANRREIDDALKFQLPLAKEMVEDWGLPVARREGWEADDLIAALAAKAVKKGMDVVVVSGDKDILQLVDDRVKVLNEAKGILYDADEVEKKYGLKPGQLVDYFALVGDASDNVPGVQGVGPKTAVTLLREHGTLDKIYRNLDSLKATLKDKLAAEKESALLSRWLVTLAAEAPIDLDPSDCAPRPPSPKLFALFQRFQFNTLLADLGGPSAPEAAAAPPPPAVSQRTVVTVLDEDSLTALTHKLKNARELAVDVETTGTDPLRADLVGISLAVKPGEGFYIPVRHSYLGVPKQLSWDVVRKAVGPFLTDATILKVGQNLKYDLLVLDRHGVEMGGDFFDTLIASYCLNPGRLSHGLKGLAADLLGEAMTEISALIGTGAKQITMDEVKIEDAAPYAAADAEVSLRLKSLMAKDLEEKKLDALFHDVEMPLMPILAAMEKVGIKVDRAYLERLRTEFTGDIAALEKEMASLAGETINFNSTKQLAALLFDRLKLPVVRKTKTGFSTDEEVLQKLADKHPLPAKLLEYRELMKLTSTYVVGLLERADAKTGRVHSSFNQAVAATGRLSSTDPNLQNIPIRTEAGRRIRRAFIPMDGCVFLSGDYSQIDLRVLAHTSGDKALREAFRRGEDIHAATAREIFGVPADKPVPDEDRRIAKSVNFGIVYGQTPFGLSQQLGIPMAQAKDYIDRYLARYAGVATWMKEIVEQARRDGYVTTFMNRRRYLPEIKAANPAVRGFAERTAMNTPIQGGSADIIKVAMREVRRLLADKSWKTRMLLQVHDDLLFEVPLKELPEAAPAIKKIMETAVPLDVPVVVDLKKGVNWADMERMR